MALSPIFPQLESANGELRVGDHDDLKRTQDEIDRNVTPVSFAFRAGHASRYGYRGDAIADDTVAIQTAIDCGAGLVTIPFTSTGGRITDTLRITDKQALAIEGEAATYASPPNANATLLWFGGTAKPMIEVSNTSVSGGVVFGLKLERLTLDGHPDGAPSRATCGIAFGPLGSAVNQLIKWVHTEHISIRNCRIGAWFGRDAAHSADIAFHTHTEWYVSGCLDHGILLDTGNGAAINFVGSFIGNNGYSPTNDATNGDGGNGANFTVLAGELTLTGTSSGGSGGTQPATADIRLALGSVKINGHWSDTHGKFLAGNGTQACYLNGVRHFEGSMTAGNTPDSIEWGGPQPLVLQGCYLYGNVTGTSGNSTHIIDIGSRLVRSGAAFTGTQITTNNGYIGIGGYDGVNEARASFGKPVPADGGGFKPFTLHYTDLKSGFRRQASTFGITEMLNSSGSSWEMLINAYYDGAFKSITAGKVGRLFVSGGADPSLIIASEADAAAADETQTFPTNHFSALSAQPTGGSAIKTIKLGTHTMAWHSAAPTAGTWVQGDVIWSTGVGAGGSPGWVCTTGGTPGTWKAMSNVAA